MDSLLALLLLQEAGIPVVAIHGRFLPATPERVQREAALGEICAAHGIPLHILSLEEQFRDRVIHPFVRAYGEGRTPNPCALCNAAMKWGVLWDAARHLGAKALATGHYARWTEGRLLRGTDPRKDQSYFLALVPPDRLAASYLPLGCATKDWVRQALARRGITVPQERESQDICFVPDSYHHLMAQHGYTDTPGPVVLADGTPVGRHHGLWRLTIGQRRGLGIAFREPLFVLAKDPATNTAVVGPKAATLAWGCTTEEANIFRPPHTWPHEISVQTSYRQKPQKAQARLETHGGLRIRFHEPGPRPTPGQVAVLYAGDEVLAGALIASSVEQP
jgi:tRNA-specific 2-thiouridylase